MPDLYRFENYEKCKRTYESEALYCVANAYIKPDSTSEVYQIIKRFSNLRKQHLRHDKVQRGICVNDCKLIVQRLGNISEKYLVPAFPMDSNVNNF